MIGKNYKALRDLRGGDLSDIFDDLKKNGAIFSANFEILAKRFLEYVLPINTFTVGFETLLQHYLAESSEEPTSEIVNTDVPRTEADFYNYICKTYLSIVKEPQSELLTLYDRTIGDIKEIDLTLKDISDKLSEIHSRNDPHEIQEKNPVFYYYQAQNEKARQEIMDFLFNDIKHFALRKCYDRSLFGDFLGDIPYNYRWNPRSYKPKMPNDLDNKFGDLPVRLIKESKTLYETDRGSFNETLHNYIRETEVVFSIKNLLPYHHILQEKSEIIYEALNIYENGIKIMFTCAVPTIIEGILHDLCLLINERESDLLQKGFQYKLDKLLPILTYELDYEYYSFRFRIFRNKVAHGRLTNRDVDELADLLLLDLYQMCKLVSSTKIKMNQKRFLIDELSKNLTNPDYKFLIEYIFLTKLEIPDFYKLNEKITEIEKIISSNQFWEFLHKQLMEGSEVQKHGIVALTKIISARKPFDKRCTSLFKKAGFASSNSGFVNDYLRDLRTYY